MVKSLGRHPVITVFNTCGDGFKVEKSAEGVFSFEDSGKNTGKLVGIDAVISFLGKVAKPSSDKGGDDDKFDASTMVRTPHDLRSTLPVCPNSAAASFPAAC